MTTLCTSSDEPFCKYHWTDLKPHKFFIHSSFAADAWIANVAQDTERQLAIG